MGLDIAGTIFCEKYVFPLGKEENCSHCILYFPISFIAADP
jgi:hypothetical protein